MSEETTQTLAPVLDYSSDPAEENRVISKIVWRLTPFLCLLYIVNYLDRTNIAMAKLSMLGDLGLSEAQYGRLAGLFFIGYFLFEVPSNLILERVGARIWLARIMISWGIISTAMMFVAGPTSFYWLRFGLGLAEAGFFPGVLLYLTYWVPSNRRAGALAAFVTSTALSGMIGNPLAGLLMKLDGLAGLHGWQWLFMLEGFLPIILGFVVLTLLPDRPANAKWLAPEERDWIERELAAEHHASHHHVADVRQALTNPHLWLLCANYFMLIMGFFGFIYWLPTIVKEVSHGSDVQVGFLSAIPYMLATVCMILIGRHADRTNERRWHASICLAVGAIGMSIIPLTHTTATTLLWLCVSAIGIWGSIAPFWALATRYLRGNAAAAGIAIINSVGCLAGYVAPSFIGWAKDRTNSFSAGLLVVAAALFCGAGLALCVPKAIDCGNN
jgi:D-galactonate transporter